MNVRNRFLSTDSSPRSTVTSRRSTVDGRPLTLFFLLMFFILANVVQSSAQSKERKLIRDGNKLYNEKKFTDAEVSYKKSLSLNKNSIPGNYNLGNAYYKEGKFEEASQQYQSIFSNNNMTDEQKAKAFHNIGNSMLQAKKYPESIEAFKNSLKMSPKDNDTRYNLAYAQSMLRQQQQQQQQQGKDNKDQKNKDQQKKEQKEQQNKEDQKQDKEQQKQANQKKQDISKEDAEKILQALNNDEKNIQKKLIKKEATRIQIEKQW